MQTKRLSRRKLEAEKPKSRFPLRAIRSSLVAVFFWIALLFIFYFVDPNITGVIPFFIFLFALGVFFTTSIFVKNIRQKLLITFVASLFLILKYFKMGNIINLLLILGIALAYEWYSQKSD